jgi:hypothetical protein
LNQQPTGLGAECDRCACESCLNDIAPCILTASNAWNSTCGALSRCVGGSEARGLCMEDMCMDQCEAQYRASGLQLARAPGPLFAWWCDFGTECTAFLAVQQNCYAWTCAQACKP